MEWRPATATLAGLCGAFALGSLSFADLVARMAADADLRRVGTGTVSATNVYRVAGVGPFLAVAMLDVGKGAVAAKLAARSPASAAALVVVGHNWSPLLRGAGGRGVLPALGALLVTAPAGAALLAGGIIAGWVGGDTAPGCFVAQVLMVPVVAAAAGRCGAQLAAAVAVPMLAKRLIGNRPARDRTGRVYLTRLVFDRDVR
jgi:acyl phosphate:glycerol-3-phosphate acyltransferase